MSELQLKRGTAAAIAAYPSDLDGEPFVTQDVRGQLQISNGTDKDIIADTTATIPTEVELFALTATKQGDVYVVEDSGKVFKRTTPGNAGITISGDWQRIGSVRDAGSVVEWVAKATDIDPLLDEIWIDVNTTDWTGHPHADPDNPQNIVIYPNEIVFFSNDTEKFWRWVGSKPVSLGQGTVPPTTPDPITFVVPALHISVMEDYALSSVAVPNTSIELVDFTVSDQVGVNHHYSVTETGVTVLIPSGLSVHHRFQILCQSDTIIDYGSIKLNYLAGKTPTPLNDNALLSFVVVGVDDIDLSGDLGTGSPLTVDSDIITVDSDIITADATKYKT